MYKGRREEFFKKLLEKIVEFTMYHVFFSKDNDKLKVVITGYTNTAMTFFIYLRCKIFLNLDSSCRHFSYDSECGS